jgi:hypothetical protein
MSTFGTRVLTDPVSQWFNSRLPWWQTYKQRSVDVAGPITVAADATPHVKGAWVQIIASTSADADFMVFAAGPGGNGLDTATLIDIAVGASGSETPIVENIAVGGWAVGFQIGIPIKIPSGSRIAMRTQSVVASRNASVEIQLLDTGFYEVTPLALDVYGSNTANSEGVVTSTSFVEITSATTKAYRAIIIVPSLTSGATSITVNLYNLGVGPSGSETIVGSTRFANGTQEILNVRYMPYNIVGGFVPAGTRLSVQGSSASGTQDVCLIGIPY